MDLVQEQERRLLRMRLGIGHCFPHFLDPGQDCREGHEVCPNRSGEEPRQRRLPGSRRAPENGRMQLTLQQPEQRLAPVVLVVSVEH